MVVCELKSISLSFIVAFYVTITDADIGVLNLSIHYLIRLWTIYAGEIRRKSFGPKHIQFELFGNKMVNCFWENIDSCIDAISKDLSVT